MRVRVKVCESVCESVRVVECERVKESENVRV